jgi:hypothetical protein
MKSWLTDPEVLHYSIICILKLSMGKVAYSPEHPVPVYFIMLLAEFYTHKSF